jgi:DNA modification methylase
MDIKLIKPNPDNPRVIKDEKFKKLVASIRDFPEMLELRPIVIDETNTVLGGNMRLRALQELGYKEVPVIFAKDLTEEQKKEFIIKDNIGYGEWDWDSLANDWDTVKLEEWGLDIPGFVRIEPEDGQDDVPDVLEAVTVMGDLWEMNGHRLLCGDSCNTIDIDRLMNGRKADLIFTDPPYDLKDSYTGLILNEAKDDCHIFIMDGDKNTVKRASNFPESFRHMFVVDIRIARMISNSQPMQRHTLIAHFLKGKRKFNNLKDGFTTLIESATDHKTIDGFNQHKRVELPETFILHYSQPHELICDYFGGAGSTLIAADKNNRNCYLLELDPKHCDIILKRWILYKMQHSELLEVTKNGEKQEVNSLCNTLNISILGEQNT